MAWYVTTYQTTKVPLCQVPLCGQKYLYACDQTPESATSLWYPKNPLWAEPSPLTETRNKLRSSMQIPHQRLYVHEKWCGRDWGTNYQLSESVHFSQEMAIHMPACILWKWETPYAQQFAYCRFRSTIHKLGMGLTDSCSPCTCQHLNVSLTLSY